jgi:AcrR family transcriptional regulator
MKKTDLRLEREHWRRQEYRQSILKAAEKIVAQKGYSAMTMDDVAREAEFSKATLYHYFKGKGELILQIIESFFDEIRKGLAKVRRLRVSARERLKRGIYFYLQFNQKKENISRVLMMDKSFIEKLRIFVTGENKLTSEVDRRFINSIKAKRREILADVAQILREGVENKEFRPMDIQATIIFFEAVLQGYYHVKLWHERHYSLDEAAELIYSFFLHGIERKEGRTKGVSR